MLLVSGLSGLAGASLSDHALCYDLSYRNVRLLLICRRRWQGNLQRPSECTPASRCDQ